MFKHTLIAAALALPVAAFAGDETATTDTETMATEIEVVGTIDYTEGLVQQALADGKTVFIEYNTPWCTTCSSQKRTMAQLKADNPEYEQHITFVRVNFDDWGSAPVSVDRNVLRRSTLIAETAAGEIGRIIAGTSTEEIKALMDAALMAAMDKMMDASETADS